MITARALICCIAALLCGQAPAAEPRIVDFVCDPWPPYVLGKMGEQARSGPGVEIMQAIFERLENVELRISLMPWKRALREVERGTRDGVALLLKTPDRERYMLYSDVVFTSHNAVWYTSAGFPEGFEWHSYADFRQYNIGTIRGHSYGEELDQIISAETFQVFQVTSAEHLFAMLERGRVDLAVADRLVGAAMVQRHTGEGTRFIAAERPAATEIYHISLSKKSPHRGLMPAINRAIAQLQDEGVIQKLLGETEAPQKP